VEMVQIGVIGGSGLYDMPEISDKTTQSLDTPFGRPSGDVVIGTLRGKRVAFLPRHGLGHVYSPSAVPYRANIYALKSLGVRYIISVSACGSLREDFAPGDIVIPDQVYDNTRAERGRSFFDKDLVAHVSVADPFCSELSEVLFQASQKAGATVHRGGTFVTIEGPRFSTRGESQIFRQLGCSIVGMTACPEVFLAREAEIGYATMAHITDYDVWHKEEGPVTADKVVETLKHNLAIAQKAVALAVEMLDAASDCDCHHALKAALMTNPQYVSPSAVERLKAIVGRYYPSQHP
jgi:5'-methylthioadenosine phosphorylase